MKFLISTLSRLSLKQLYRLSDWVLYPLMYYVIRYRRSLAITNLRLSFPEKTEKEIQALAKRFYHHFADIVAEIIWYYRATDEEMNQHIHFVNVKEIEQMADTHKGLLVMLGHLGNWEWTTDVQRHYTLPGMQHYNVYRRLKNKGADTAMLELRCKHSGEGSCIEKNALLRQLIILRKAALPFTLGLISDQKVAPKNAYHKTMFLHQETTFLGGGEVLSKKFNWSVAYVHMRQVQRGEYEARVDLITDDAPNTEKGYITEQFARRLEQNIQEQPELWLWTHNRWKWERLAQQEHTNS